ncbi:MAG: DUF92 domain-containing protein [Anaerolineae bacterium]
MEAIALGLGLSLAIAGLGFWAGALTPSGFLGAVAVGTLIFGLGGWTWGVLLILFFVSSSALTRFRELEKRPLAGKFAKGRRRDLGQTMANGGVGALLAVAQALQPNGLWTAAFVGSMAAVNADTWATEVGTLSPIEPRLLSTGRRVPAGTSGAVSPLGTAASFAGALLIGIAGMALFAVDRLSAGAGSSLKTWALPAGLVGGLGGSLVDSLLGATVQRVNWCPSCQVETERAVHDCGTETRHLRGWAWLGNDAVNGVASAVGAGLGAATYMTLGR